ncbi:hypothetical protein [Streptomyces liangshanensis]|uniref:hypothetical protein n=1 Tax=Streptomyces liangshanensis TaxID=2717324 RepID=UPI0036DEDA2C
MSSAYILVYQGLVKGGMPAPVAAGLLARLRQEDGAELADGLREHATAQYSAGPNDSRAIYRRRAAQFGAMRRAADWVLSTTAASRLTTMPRQRTPRSTA